MNNHQSPKTFASNGSGTGTKTYILSPDVHRHDPGCFLGFAEHNVVFPLHGIDALEELQRGRSSLAENAQDAIQTIENIVASNGNVGFENGFSLEKISDGKATGRFFIDKTYADQRKRKRIGDSSDNMVIALAATKAKQEQGSVILVSRRAGLRVKAAAAGILAEDYRWDRVIDDIDRLYSGYRTLPDSFWTENSRQVEVRSRGPYLEYEVKGSQFDDISPNEFFYANDPDRGPLQLVVAKKGQDSLILRTITNYRNKQNSVCGIHARNDEQNLAFHLAMNPAIDFATIVGMAGSGKTIVALAAGLHQVMAGRYNKLMYVKATMPIGRDDGFVPGDEVEKILPGSKGLLDNLEVLRDGDKALDDWIRSLSKNGIRGRSGPLRGSTTLEEIEKVVDIRSLNHIRGSSAFKRFLIIDEAQNLNAHQITTIVTRAGQGTKALCLGNLMQMDTPELTANTCGLTHAVEHFKDWSHSGHIILRECERSRLAAYGALMR